MLNLLLSEPIHYNNMSDGQKVTCGICFFPLACRAVAIYSSLPKPMPLQNQPDMSCSFGQVMYSFGASKLRTFSLTLPLCTQNLLFFGTNGEGE